MLNVRSLVNKFTPSFESFVYASDFDIFCVTETWLSECIYDCEMILFCIVKTDPLMVEVC